MNANDTHVRVLSGSSVRSVRVSVVVPTYERIGPLRLLLESVAAQQLEDGGFEVVVSDDGSGPDVATLASALAPRFERMVFVRGPNAGPGVARNRGVAHALGHVIAFIDSDCLARPRWLEELTRAVERGGGIAHGPVVSSTPPIEPFVHSFQIRDRPIPGGNLAMSRSDFERVGGFRADVSRIAEDHDLVLRCRDAGYLAVFVPDAEVEHPPRLKRFRIDLIPTPRLVSTYTELANYYGDSPERRVPLIENNRILAGKAAAKLAIVITPLMILPRAAWLAGAVLLWSIALRKWVRSNRALQRAGVPARVPIVDVIKYALALPVQDLITLAHRARFGLLQMW